MEQLRYPRPQALTAQVQAYQAIPSTQNKKNNLKKLRTIAIQHYLNNQLTTYKLYIHPTLTKRSIRKASNDKTKRFGLQVMDLADLSLFLGLSQVKVEKRIQDYLIRQAKRMQEDGTLDDMRLNSRAAAKGLFFGSLNRMQSLMAWEDELKQASRSYFHQPGYSASANTAIGLTSSFMAQVQRTIDALSPKEPSPSHPSIQIHNNNNAQAAVLASDGQEVLTTAQAVLMLDEAKITYMPLDDRDKAFAHLYEAHIEGNPEIPNVTATQYDAQGVAKSKTLDILVNHENRREIEETGEIQDAVEE